jgi:pSer/pThr/pTyr-binding forkhead associated (FHA) protein
MSASIEVWRPSGVERTELAGRRVTIGADPSSEVCIADDDAVSALHALLEDYGSGWTLRDLGSRNGTYVNGDRVVGERALHAGDELRVGQTRLIFKAMGGPVRQTAVLARGAPPELTRRERDVLLALCRPLASVQPFRQPASIRAIAEELVVTEAAVKQHLLRLYDKFGLTDQSENRRVRLANEAILRGVFTLSELQVASP